MVFVVVLVDDEHQSLRCSRDTELFEVIEEEGTFKRAGRGDRHGRGCFCLGGFV